ncbi:PREDICTED: scale keratin-like [Calidris pugnax]|nr:PREDICTED: scale keratin-like [Calidris pugnax]
MSCYDLCPPKTSVAVPQPIAESCNDLCTRQCPDSTAFIQPPPVMVTFPGPILSSFPQQAVVGSSGAPAFGGNLGLGGLYGAGATQGSGGLCTFGRAYAAPACSPCAGTPSQLRSNTSRRLLHVSKDGDSTNSQDNVCQCLVTLTVKTVS